MLLAGYRMLALPQRWISPSIGRSPVLSEHGMKHPVKGNDRPVSLADVRSGGTPLTDSYH